MDSNECEKITQYSQHLADEIKRKIYNYVEFLGIEGMSGRNISFVLMAGTMISMANIAALNTDREKVDFVLDQLKEMILEMMDLNNEE